MIFTEKKDIEKKNIIVLISPWKSPLILYYFIKKIIPAKYGYIHYAYTKDTLNSDPKQTKHNFLQFIEKIKQDLDELEKTKPRNFFLYGQSLGGLFCMIVADKIDVKKVMLVAPGANLAESFWYGNRTSDLRKEMEKRGMTIKKLKKYWQEISPDNYFKRKSLHVKFFVILSDNDKAIPTANGKKLIELLKRKHVKVKLEETLLPHTEVCLRESLFTKKFSRCLIKKD